MLQQRSPQDKLHIMSKLSPEKQELIRQDQIAISQLLGLKNPQPLGAGEWGRVYHAQDLNDKLIAVKSQSAEEYLDQEYAAAEILNQLPTEYFIKSF
ncbi:MAG: hypothetical protein EZS28_002297, partial [Streblomastix strix]